MSNVILLKRSTTAADPGTALGAGELAYSYASNKLFIGNINGVGNPATALAGPGMGFLTANQNINITGDATGSGNTAIALNLASTGIVAGIYTKLTVDAKGRATAGTSLTAADIPALTASKIADFDTQVRSSRLDQLAAPTNAVSLNNQRITNLGAPTQPSDAVNKSYVDAIQQGIDHKESVRAASTGNISIASPGTAIDGVTLAAGNRILLKDQTNAFENGIYIFNGSTSALTRSLDADSSAEVTSGMFTFVEEGTVNADNSFVLITNNPITLGTTNLVFTQFSGAGQINAGAGMTKTGNTLDVVGTANRIVVNPDSIDIASTYAGQTSITTVGNITSGTWNGTTLSVARGGTGVTSITGLLKGNGANAFTVAVAGTDYLDPNSTIDGGTF